MSLKVLIIEDNRGDYILMRSYITQIEEFTFDLYHAENLKLGKAMMLNLNPEVILLDLGLPDSTGIESIKELIPADKHNCLIVTTGNRNEELGREAVRNGAQDYLNKNDLSPSILAKTILFSLERVNLRKNLLKEQQQNILLSAALDKSGRPAVITDMNYNIVYCNAEFKNQFDNVSYIHEELVMASFAELAQLLVIHRESPEIEDQVEIQISKSKDKPEWYLLTIEGLSILDSAFLVFNFQNIEILKKGEQKIRDNEEKLSSVVNSFDDLLFTLDTNLRCSEIFGDSWQTFGKDADMLIGAELSELLDGKLSRSIEKNFKAALQGSRSTFIWERKLENRTEHYQTKLSPMMKDKKVVGVLGVSRNISDLKEKEKQLISSEKLIIEKQRNLESFIHTIPDPTFSKDLAGKYLFVNQAFLDFVGMPLKKVIGYTNEEVFAKFSNTEDLDRGEKSLGNGSSDTLKYETKIKCKTGEWIDLELHKSIYKESETLRKGVVGVFRDITQVKKFQEEILKVNASMEELAISGFDMLQLERKEDLFDYLLYKLQQILSVESVITLAEVHEHQKKFTPYDLVCDDEKIRNDFLETTEKVGGNYDNLHPTTWQKLENPVLHKVPIATESKVLSTFSTSFNEKIRKASLNNHIYFMGIYSKLQLKAFIAFVEPSNEQVVDFQLLHTLINQASIVYERIEVQKQLNNRKTELDRALDISNASTVIMDCKERTLFIGSNRSGLFASIFRKDRYSLSEFTRLIGKQSQSNAMRFEEFAENGSKLDIELLLSQRVNSCWVRIQLQRNEENSEIAYGAIRDITREKEDAQQIELLNFKILNALEGSNSGIFQFDKKSNQIYLDRRSASFFGYENEITLNFDEFKNQVVEGDLNLVEFNRRFTKKASLNFDIIYRIKTPEKGIRYIKASGYYQKEKKGGFRYVNGINQDVTAEKQRQLELEQNRHQLATLAQTATELANLSSKSETFEFTAHMMASFHKAASVVVSEKIDLAQGYKIVSRVERDRLLTKIENILGQKLSEIEFVTNPARRKELEHNEVYRRNLDHDDLLSLGLTGDQAHKVIKMTDGALHLTWIGWGDRSDKHGTVCFVTSSTTNLFDENTAKAFLSQVTSVLDKAQAIDMLKESESKYRQLVENSPAILYNYHLDEGGVYRSGKIFEILGIEENEVLHDAHYYEKLIHPEDLPKIQSAIEDFQKGTPFEVDYRLLHQSGSWIWVKDISINKYDKEARLVTGLVFDITKEKELNLLLSREQKLLEEAQKVGGLGTWTYNVNEGSSWWSNSLYNILGKGSEEKPERIDLLDQIEQPMQSVFEKLIGSGLIDEKASYRFKYLRGDEWIILYTECKLTREENTGDVQLIGFTRDITEEEIEKRTNAQNETKLVKSQEQLALATAEARLGIVDWDVASQTAQYNDTFYELFDLPAEEQIPNPEDIMDKYIYPEDSEPLQKLIYSVFQGKNEVVEGVYRIISGKGIIKWISFKGKSYTNEQGRIRRFMAVLSNITDLKRLQIEVLDKNKQLDNLINAVPGIVFNAFGDSYYSMSYISPYVKEMSGYRPEEFYPEGPIPFSEIIHPKDREPLKKVIEQAFVEKRTYETSYKVISKNGGIRWFWEKGSFKSFDNPLEITEIEGVILDITDRINSEDKILKAAVEASDNERKRIAQDIHDGIQQLLVAALLNLESVKKEKNALSSKMQKRFATSFEYLNQGISETRSIARKLMPKAIEDFGLVNAINEMVNGISDDVEIIFEDNLDGNRLSENAEIGLYRIVQECINNILKYAEASKITINLKINGDFVTLDVGDNGKGFETTDPGTAHGYGLSSMRSRAASLGGTIYIDSKKNKGTNVLTEIPYNKL